MDIILKNVLVNDANQVCDIAIKDGKIEKVEKNLTDVAQRVIDAEARVLIPGLVETHIHLDKALIAERLPNQSGTLQEALKVTAELKSTFTAEDVAARAEKALRMLLRKGATYIRTHAEFDPLGGFHSFEEILKLREKYKEYADIQVVAFPQEGIIKAPGTYEMMERALAMGADVVGGIPYNDTDPLEHLNLVFALAKKYDVDIDLHQDFFDDYEKQTIELVCKKTIAEGYEGRVSVGHMTSIGAMPEKALEPILELMAKAKINVMCLPMTDLHLGGRNDTYKVRRAITPMRKLRDAGINVCLGGNNIRNPFTPYGNGDLIQVAMLAIPVAHLGGADDLPSVLPMITTCSAKALGLKNYGLNVGNTASLVLLDTHRYQDAIIDIPDRALVINHGRITLEQSKSCFTAF